MHTVIGKLHVRSKLAVLGAVGLVAAVVVTAVGIRALHDVDGVHDQRAALLEARGELNFLSHRMSELKADAFHVYVSDEASGGTAAIVDETVEDAATIGETWDRIDALGLDRNDAMDELRAASEAYADDTIAFVRDAAAFLDSLTAQLDAGDLDGVVEAYTASTSGASEVVDRNRATDDTFDAAMGALDGEIARLSAHVDDSRAGAARMLYVTLALALAAGAALWLVLARAIGRPLTEAAAVLAGAADGDLTRRLEVTSADEVGELGAALNTTLERTASVVGAITESAEALARSAEELSSVSTQLGAVIEETSSQAGTVSASAEQVSTSVSSSAAAADQLGASIREIAGSASEAARVALGAVEVAESTNQTVARLGESSNEIGEVLRVITSIAEQTNLLALNATIEAARAGEAGKGFAVVANEVKELATQTAKATEEIDAKIGAIQTDAHAAVAAIGDIAAVIGQINDIQATIAAAVEEQTVTTGEIGRGVNETATGASEIASAIAGVAQAATDGAAGAAQAMTAARELAEMAERLNGLVAQFHVGDGLVAASV